MKADSSSADAIYVRGLCLYFKDNLDKGLTHFQQVLQLDPDHSKARIMRLKAKNLKEKKENGKKNPILISFNSRNVLIKFTFFFCDFKQATIYLKLVNSVKPIKCIQKHWQWIH